MNLSLLHPFGHSQGDAPMKLRVLLADDQAVCRETLRRLLIASGLGDFRFEEVADGEAALKQFDPKRFDLVFMDHHMPKIEGIVVATRIRAARGRRIVPMIIVSGDGRMGVLEDALDVAQADNFLRKPFTFDELKHCVAPIFERLRAERA